MQQLLDGLLVGAIELVNQGKGVTKVVPSAMASLAKPPFKLSAKVIESLIESSCKHKRLLSKQFADN